MNIENPKLLAALREIPGWDVIEEKLNHPLSDEELAEMEANVEAEFQRSLLEDVHALPDPVMPIAKARGVDAPASAKSVTKRTTKVSIRLRTDVLTALKEKAMTTPTGYQKLINKILRMATQAERASRLRRRGMAT